MARDAIKTVAESIFLILRIDARFSPVDANSVEKFGVAFAWSVAYGPARTASRFKPRARSLIEWA